MQTEAGLKAVEPGTTQKGRNGLMDEMALPQMTGFISVPNWEKSKWNVLWVLYTGTKC